MGHAAHQCEAEDVPSLWLPLVGLLDHFELCLELMFWELLQLEEGLEAFVLVVVEAVPGHFLGHAAHQCEAEDLPSLWLPLVGLLDPLGLCLELMFGGIFAVFGRSSSSSNHK